MGRNKAKKQKARPSNQAASSSKGAKTVFMQKDGKVTSTAGMSSEMKADIDHLLTTFEIGKDDVLTIKVSEEETTNSTVRMYAKPNGKNVPNGPEGFVPYSTFTATSASGPVQSTINVKNGKFRPGQKKVFTRSSPHYREETHVIKGEIVRSTEIVMNGDDFDKFPTDEHSAQKIAEYVLAQSQKSNLMQGTSTLSKPKIVVTSSEMKIEAVPCGAGSSSGPQTGAKPGAKRNGSDKPGINNGGQSTPNTGAPAAVSSVAKSGTNNGGKSALNTGATPATSSAVKFAPNNGATSATSSTAKSGTNVGATSSAAISGTNKKERIPMAAEDFIAKIQSEVNAELKKEGRQFEIKTEAISAPKQLSWANIPFSKPSSLPHTSTGTPHRKPNEHQRGNKFFTGKPNDPVTTYQAPHMYHPYQVQQVFHNGMPVQQYVPMYQERHGYNTPLHHLPLEQSKQEGASKDAPGEKNGRPMTKGEKKAAKNAERKKAKKEAKAAAENAKKKAEEEAAKKDDVEEGETSERPANPPGYNMLLHNQYGHAYPTYTYQQLDGTIHYVPYVFPDGQVHYAYGEAFYHPEQQGTPTNIHQLPPGCQMFPPTNATFEYDKTNGNWSLPNPRAYGNLFQHPYPETSSNEAASARHRTAELIANADKLADELANFKWNPFSKLVNKPDPAKNFEKDVFSLRGPYTMGLTSLRDIKKDRALEQNPNQDKKRLLAPHLKKLLTFQKVIDKDPNDQVRMHLFEDEQRFNIHDAKDWEIISHYIQKTVREQMRELVKSGLKSDLGDALKKHIPTPAVEEEESDDKSSSLDKAQKELLERAVAFEFRAIDADQYMLDEFWKSSDEVPKHNEQAYLDFLHSAYPGTEIKEDEKEEQVEKKEEDGKQVKEVKKMRKPEPEPVIDLLLGSKTVHNLMSDWKASKYVGKRMGLEEQMENLRAYIDDVAEKKKQFAEMQNAQEGQSSSGEINAIDDPEVQRMLDNTVEMMKRMSTRDKE